MCGICGLQIHLRQITDGGSRPAPQRLSSYISTDIDQLMELYVQITACSPDPRDYPDSIKKQLGEIQSRTRAVVLYSLFYSQDDP